MKRTGPIVLGFVVGMLMLVQYFTPNRWIADALQQRPGLEAGRLRDHADPGRHQPLPATTGASIAPARGGLGLLAASRSRGWSS